MLWSCLPRSATLPLTLTTLLLACGGADPADEGHKDGSAAAEDTADGGDGDGGASADEDTASAADTADTADGGEDSGDLGPAPSFEVDVEPMFQGACGACHYGEPEGLHFFGEGVYELLVNHASGQLPTMDRVEPGSLSQSYLWRKLQGTHVEAGGSGAEMPPSGGYPPSLSEEQLRVVERWIEGGALP
jgi:hypothetical protein